MELQCRYATLPQAPPPPLKIRQSLSRVLFDVSNYESNTIENIYKKYDNN